MSSLKRYTMGLGISFALYAIALLVSITVVKALPEDNLLRPIIAILPVLACIPGLWTYLRYLRELDELQQRIQMEALGLSLALTGLTTFTLGFLENAGLEPIGMIWVFPMSILFWGIGQQFAMRRYA